MTEVVRSDELESPQLETVFARAFENDPFAAWLWPDAAIRRHKLRWIISFGCKYAYRYGEVYRTAGEIQGGSLWLKPGKETITLRRLARLDLLLPLLRVGVTRPSRLAAAAIHFKARPKRMRRPYWYLLALGVDPARQRQGNGSALIQPGLREADAAGLACYLSTAKETNLAFYERHGFRVVNQSRVGGASGPEVWTMRRDPGA